MNQRMFKRQATLQNTVNRLVNKQKVKGAVFRLENRTGTIVHSAAGGNLQADTPFYIASINKLLLSAIALRLVAENKIALTDPANRFLPASLTQGLHVWQGNDVTGKITIQHLLSQTSGLPCYLLEKGADGKKMMQQLLNGEDRAMSLEDVVERVKGMKKLFAPGQKDRASYGNTNFRLLGGVLETVTGQKLPALLNDLFTEAGMNKSFVYENAAQPVQSFYTGEKTVWLPKYLSSSGYDVFSTTGDLMMFLKAFFNGRFFPVNQMRELEQWNNIFFPFRYGIGLQQFYTPRWLSPFKAIPAMVGHSGSVGTAAFYVPAEDIFVTATINQTHRPQLLYQNLVRTISRL